MQYTSRDMSVDHDNTLTKSQKSTPASILKQLRATAAVMCYDHCYGLHTMPTTELQRKMFNMYHGVEDLNILSQVEIMCAGKAAFSHLFNSIQTVITNTEPKISDDCEMTNPSKLLVLHPS